ncbi:hypothetical protein ACE939_12380 [Aquimarina sp. W85]|uniref:hypothetical protein n=1 Tax=Aquimarina rhodophyticola TaxID=3342246 RepID=UPI003672637B
MEQIITSFLIAIIFFTIAYALIAFVEGRGTIKKLYQNNYHLIFASVGYFFVILLLFYLLTEFLKNGKSNYGIIGLTGFIIKLIMASYVSKKAAQQNRSSILWYILGLLEFHSALIALGISKAIYKIPNTSKPEFITLNQEVKEKIASFKAIKSNSNKDKQKEYKIKQEYWSYFDDLLNKISENNTNTTELEKYKRALKSGVISQDEYDLKISKFL